MKINTKKIDNNKIEISIEIPKLLVESYFKTASEELSKDFKINGFRQGKAPVDVIEKQVGSEKLYNQATDIAIQRSLPGAIKDENLEIVGQPEIKVDKIVKNEIISYRAIFQLMPEVEIKRYKGIEIKKKQAKVEDKEIEKSLDYLKNSRTKLITVNRPAQKGDRIEIDFKVKHGNVKIEDGESKNHPLIIGEQKFLPGFEKQVEGMRVGDEKNFSIKAPEEWPDKRIAGKNLDFDVKMNLVQERKIPKIDDEFAKSLGQFKTLSELKESIKDGLIKEKQQQEKEKTRIELIEKVADESKADIPDFLINQEVESMMNEFVNNIKNIGLEFDKYLKQINKTVDDLKKEWRKQAKKRVKIGLCIKEIAKKENINVSEKEVEEKINEDLKKYPDVEAIKKNIDLETLKDYTKNILKNEKVFEFLEENAITKRSE